MNDFYVYVYKNPLNNENFYVGKGRGRRSVSHLNEARLHVGNGSHKTNTIKKILAAGAEPIITIVDKDLSEDQAFELEMFLISEIGRRDLDTGTLTNKTNGGEGSVGYKHTAESLEKISASQKGKVVSESTRILISKNSRSAEVWVRPELVAKVSGANHWNFGKSAPNKGTTWSDEQRRKQSERFSGENHPMFGKPCSEQRKEAIRAGTLGVKKSTTEKMKKPKAKLTCPHCAKVGGTGNMQRWHFDNCKMREIK